MILLETAPTTPIDRPNTPVALTCAVCPLARRIENDRYVCTMSQTASDVVRGHWQATVSCLESIAQHEAEQTFEPVAEVEMAIAPATSSTPAPVATAPTATGQNEELPNRGDNGRGRLQQEPVKKVSTVQISGKNREEPAAKKLMLTLVAVKRISSLCGGLQLRSKRTRNCW